jgi:hypothetical protein
MSIYKAIMIAIMIYIKLLLSGCAVIDYALSSDSSTATLDAVDSSSQSQALKPSKNNTIGSNSDTTKSGVAGTNPIANNNNEKNASNVKSANKNSENPKATAKNDTSTNERTADSPVEDQPLFFDTEGLIDDDGIGKMNYKWEAKDANGNWLLVGNAESFTPKQEHVGMPLRVRVEYLDGNGTLESIVTPETGPVLNVNDLPSGGIEITGRPIEDQTLRIDTSSLTDEDGLGIFTYTWERSQDKTTWSAYPGNAADPSLLRLTQNEVGFSFRGRVDYIDGFGTPESVTSRPSEVIANIDDPTMGEPRIVGDLETGSTLSIDTSALSDEDGIASISAIFEMSKEGINWQIAVETENRSLTLAKQHIGMIFRVKATVVDNFGNQAVVYSPVSKPVQNVNSKPRGSIRIITNKN